MKKIIIDLESKTVSLNMDNATEQEIAFSNKVAKIAEEFFRGKVQDLPWMDIVTKGENVQEVSWEDISARIGQIGEGFEDNTIQGSNFSVNFEDGNKFDIGKTYLGEPITKDNVIEAFKYWYRKHWEGFDLSRSYKHWWCHGGMNDFEYESDRYLSLNCIEVKDDSYDEFKSLFCDHLKDISDFLCVNHFNEWR